MFRNIKHLSICTYTQFTVYWAVLKLHSEKYIFQSTKDKKLLYTKNCSPKQQKWFI